MIRASCVTIWRHDHGVRILQKIDVFRETLTKLLHDQTIVTASAAANVLERSVTDVSLLAGMLIDKFCYHLPLYRQHRRLLQGGIQVSHSSLTTWTSWEIDPLKPIVEAQCRHVLQSCILAMDETAIEAGRKKKGKMRQAYFWPM